MARASASRPSRAATSDAPRTAAADALRTATAPAAAVVRRALLAWYDVHARALPWRVGPAERRAGARPDPYRVWLSEIMLQQTTTGHAAPYFTAFTARWPRAADLAAADEGEVMAAWAGLGYYSRARNLIAAARAVADAPGGAFPDTEAALRALPGVGGYTAAAVAAIAFDRAANVVDGNVERVMARLHAVDRPLPAAKGELSRLAAAYVGADRPGDWAQALMDLGATVCLPKRPACERCPLAAACAARAGGAPERYPRKAAKSERARRYGAVYVLLAAGRVALVRRPPEGLLGGMLSLPTTDWTPSAPEPVIVVEEAPAPADWRAAGEVDHAFTHFPLTLQVWRARTAEQAPGFVWTDAEAAAAAMPTVFAKALRAALARLV